MTTPLRVLTSLLVLGVCTPALSAGPGPSPGGQTPTVAVGPQYDSTHVYVAPEHFDEFVRSFLATFGGTSTKQSVITVTPTTSKTMSQLLQTPVGMVSVLGFTTPIPAPFGGERTGYLVTDLDAAVAAARANGAAVVVEPFPDPVGRDAIVQWPGGVNMQLYWHFKKPSYPPLQTVPENRVYLSKDSAERFVPAFLRFSHGSVTSDDPKAPGVEIGRPKDTYRRIQIESAFGQLVALVTDGHLPFPYGHETTGYEVASVTDTLAKARIAKADILVEPYSSAGRQAAIVRFPGGYIAEVHTPATTKAAR